jgi:hypothetical protein
MTSRKCDELFRVFLFFMLQPFGIMLETMLRPLVAQMVKGSKLFITLINCIFCFVWLVLLTGGLIADDMVLSGFLDGKHTQNANISLDQAIRAPPNPKAILTFLEL